MLPAFESLNEGYWADLSLLGQFQIALAMEGDTSFHPSDSYCFSDQKIAFVEHIPLTLFVVSSTKRYINAQAPPEQACEKEMNYELP